eukprot:2246419-Pleurochrysis_carterae.AAC.7
MPGDMVMDGYPILYVPHFSLLHSHLRLAGQLPRIHMPFCCCNQDISYAYKHFTHGECTSHAIPYVDRLISVIVIGCPCSYRQPNVATATESYQIPCLYPAGSFAVATCCVLVYAGAIRNSERLALDN